MQYRTLGRTGIQVSTLCLGAMMFGAWGNQDEDECRQIVDASLEAGVNFIDIADVYAAGQSEEIVGRALKGRRDNVIVATKFYNPMGDDPNRRGSSRRWIITAVEESLRRLQTDWIDLYQAHRPDENTDIDETLSALSDLVQQGKVRAIGSSTFPAEQVVEAQWAAQRNGHQRFATEQLSYSIFARHAEAAVLPTCEKYDLGVMVWAPLNGGWLTGKYRRGQALAGDSRASTNSEHFDFADDAIRERKLDLVDGLDQVAKAAGLSLIQLALGFVLSHPAITSAIMGPRTLDQLLGQLDANEVLLDDDTLDAIDALVAPGSDINPDNIGWTPPALLDPLLRRR
jgi:aryl-alcohol dehydrogenase-like predicted oxidoreductase